MGKWDTEDLRASDAIHLIAQIFFDVKMKDNMCFDAIEGLYRFLAVILVHTKSAPDYIMAILQRQSEVS